MQRRTASGLQSERAPVPGSGEKSDVGHGRLEDRKALVTDVDSGIGRGQ